MNEVSAWVILWIKYTWIKYTKASFKPQYSFNIKENLKSNTYDPRFTINLEIISDLFSLWFSLGTKSRIFANFLDFQTKDIK